jgi:CheY-like chemotaxis protein
VNNHVLVIDPHKSNRTVLKLLLSTHSLLCDEATSVEEALVSKADRQYSAVFICATLAAVPSDLNRIKQKYSQPLVILATADEKFRLGPAEKAQFLLKPLFPSRVADKLNEILPGYFSKKSAAN